MTPSARHRLTARRHRPEYSIVLVTGLLLIVGLIGLVSIGNAVSNGITPYRQMFAILLGIGAFSVTALSPIMFWHRALKYLVWAAAITSTFLFLLPESIVPEVNGAKRWLYIGDFSFQPAELIKFALLIYFASFLAQRYKNRQLNDNQETFVPAVIVLLVLSLIIVFAQRDLGTMMVILTMMVTMMYTAGMKLRYLSKIGVAIIAVGGAAILLAPHRLERFMTFLTPGGDLEGSGYHINQALIAIGSGGLFGNSLGGSVQAFGYLPEAANDSIFAVYAEMFGFAGVVILLALFGVLLVKLIRVAENAPNTYTKLLASGMFAWLFGHIAVNVGAMIGLLPLTGITLPFLSYGGSSLLFMMAGLGLVFNISRYTVYSSAKRNKRRGSNAHSDERGRHRRPHHAY